MFETHHSTTKPKKYPDKIGVHIPTRYRDFTLLTHAMYSLCSLLSLPLFPQSVVQTMKEVLECLVKMAKRNEDEQGPHLAA